MRRYAIICVDGGTQYNIAWHECLICGKSVKDTPLKKKRFVVMSYWVTDWICQYCFELEGEEKEGTW